MQYKTFTIPLFDNVQIEEELNKFLRSHKIVFVEKQIVHHEGRSYWNFLIEYLCGNNGPGEGYKGGSIDYKAPRITYKSAPYKAAHGRKRPFSTLVEIKTLVFRDAL